MANFFLGNTPANTMATHLSSTYFSGTAVQLVIFGGTQPPNATYPCDTAQPPLVNTVANPILATFTLPSGSVTNNVLTLSAVSSVTAIATGTATWFRVLNGATFTNPNKFNLIGTTICDGSVSATGGGGDLQIATTSIVANATVAISSFTYTVQQ